MLDAHSEVTRLRQSLRLKGFSENMIDTICADVVREISSMTSDLLADAMNEAVNVGGDIGSVDMIEELRAVRSSGSFEIITDSGKTDFSEAPFPMLPKLLKNAKVSSEGHLYKVIPIENKGAKGTSPNSKKISVTVDAAYRSVNEARKSAKADRDAVKTSDSSLSKMDPLSNATTLAAMQSLSNARNRNASAGMEKTKTRGPAVDFKTASSKQDPNTQWVMPGKVRNAGPALRDINVRLQESIDDAIDRIIRKYEDMY
jgi:hypothetical protein